MGLSSIDFTIDPRRIRVLREIQQRGTVTEAAVGLHLTPSAVSQQVAVLSRELGVPLLEKVGRGVRLTGQAKLLLDHASLVQAQVERARAELAAFDDGRIGTVAVAAFATALSSLVAPAIRLLEANRPGVRLTAVEADPPDIFTDLDRGDLDVAIGIDYRKAPPRGDLHFHRIDLLTDPFDLALPAGHPLADVAEVALADLAREVFVTASPGSACSEVTYALCAAAGFSPDVRHYSADWHAVAALVCVGAGIALVPRLAQPLQRPGLVIRPLTGPTPSRNVFAAVRTGAEHDPVIHAVLDALVDVADAAAAVVSALG